jgi:DivIVA domain-containing protein
VSRSFTTSFRGYDQTEVRDFLQRFADEQRLNTKRIQELEDRIIELDEELQKPPVIDEAMVTAFLGEETAKVLQTAHEAAGEMRSRAEADLRDAVEKANEVRGSYRKEVDEYTAQARAEAAADVEAMLNAAKQRAEEILDQARSSGRSVLDQVHQLRIKVLQDFAKRRRIAYSQVEQLLAGRDHLLQSVEVARSNLEDMSAALQQAEADARVAAAAARDRTLEESEPEEVELDALLAPIENPAIMDEDIRPEFVDEEDVVDDERRSSSLRIVRRRHRNVEHAPQPTKIAAHQTPIDEEKSTDPRPTIQISDFGDEPEGIRILPRETSDDESNDEGGEIIDLRDYQDQEPEVQIEEDDVDTLFAKMRADRERTVAEAERILAEQNSVKLETDEADNEEEVVELVPEKPSSEDEESREQLIFEARKRRSEELESLASRLAKRMKRVIQNEQNEILDAIRNQRGRPSMAALPKETAQRDEFANAIYDELFDAVDAGLEVSEDENTADSDESDEIVRRATRTVQQVMIRDFVASLRDRLSQAISTAAESEDVERSALDAVSAVYREVKTHSVDTFAHDALSAAYTLGIYSGVKKGTKLLWVVDDPMRACANCTDNAVSDVVSAGSKFATGHQLPPAHAGCRCLLVIIP